MKILRKEFIFNDPTPTPECHASTILKQENGNLIAAWFAGTQEKANDVMICTSCCKNGIWSAPQSITPEKDIPHWNPVLFQMNEETVYLYYKIGYTIPDWQTKVMMSKDGGRTWSEPWELIPGDTSGGRGPVKNKAIRISNGTVLAPASTEQGAWLPCIDIYEETNGWTKVDIPVSDAEPKPGLIQPTLWENPTGHIHALLRSDCGIIYKSDSEDYGKTWCTAYPTDMPNNNSGLDCTMLEDGRLLLVCNPISGNGAARSPLTVYLSTDNGQTFEKLVDLETEEGEFSYPAIIHSGNHVYITYTWNRKKITFCEIEM